MPLELPGRLTLPAVPEITGLARRIHNPTDMMVMVKALRVFEVLDKPANLNELDKLQTKADIVGYARFCGTLTGEGLVPADPIFSQRTMPAGGSR